MRDGDPSYNFREMEMTQDGTSWREYVTPLQPPMHPVSTKTMATEMTLPPGFKDQSKGNTEDHLSDMTGCYRPDNRLDSRGSSQSWFTIPEEEEDVPIGNHQLEFLAEVAPQGQKRSGCDRELEGPWRIKRQFTAKDLRFRKKGDLHPQLRKPEEQGHLDLMEGVTSSKGDGQERQDSDDQEMYEEM
ncbi:hypothetical protein QFC21_006262 [Naganishia friedmannii]|uniref:Uncharacterized protein n=1 Tax=Naganishia friedmannii TaxID=89922 RepID=A0ACC2V3W7_9TREE|nr:hypothetical protein QFC21_006262 [Naganishia friedmannii]